MGLSLCSGDSRDSKHVHDGSEALLSQVLPVVWNLNLESTYAEAFMALYWYVALNSFRSFHHT